MPAFAPRPIGASPAFAAVCASPGDAGCDPALLAFAPAAVMVVGRVGVVLIGALARTTTAVAHVGHGIQSGCQHLVIVAAGPAQPHSKWCAFLVDHKMALGARFGPRSVGFEPVSAVASK